MKSFSELIELKTFEERFRYLSLTGIVGDRTFGHERWMNQKFYRSKEWLDVRNHVIARDTGCNLSMEGYDIHDRVIIHHMNPMTPNDIKQSLYVILNPEYLITTDHPTHNAIHYGGKVPNTPSYVPRTPNDTTPWRRNVQ